MINLDDFKKLDLRVAKVLEAEAVPETDKLLKLKLDDGEGFREIVSGIADFYKPEDLIGRKIILLENLEPKVFKGIESQGMLLAADVNGEPILLMPDKDAPPGAKIC